MKGDVERFETQNVDRRKNNTRKVEILNPNHSFQN